MLDFYSQTLLSKPCQNQGFILDGFPKTFEQAKTLFEGVPYCPHYPLTPPTLSCSPAPFTVGEEEEEGEENTDDDQPK